MDDREMDEEELTAFLEAQQAAENLSFAAGGEEGDLVLDEEEDPEALEAAPDPAAAWTLDFDEDEDEFDKGDEAKLQGWDEGEEGYEEGYYEGAEEEAFYEDTEGAAEEDEFAEYDANELAAEALEAELCGDTELHSKLLAEIERRKSSGETVNSGSSGSSKRVEESFEVPLNAVGWVIGRGGERIKQIAADSGAKLSMARDDGDDPSARTRLCKVKGSEDQAAKAIAMLAAAVAEAQQASKGKKGKGKGRDSFSFGKGGKAFDKVGEGAAGQEDGICKWYAAGFCRNRCFNGSCRNGLHSSEAARKAEQEWVALAPEPGSQELLADSKLPLLLLLDLEGGGNRDGTDGEDEIIEVPILAMCPESGRELGRFHRFARPGFWDREALSMQQRFHPECFNRNSSAVPFPAIIVQMQAFICKVLQISSIDMLQKDSFLFVTCGNWDVKTAIPLQCNKPTPGTVPFETQRSLFHRWSNLKDVFREHYRLDPSRAPTGMRGMLNRLKISLQGQHHLGMDDVSNLAKIMKRMISEGCRFEGPTGTSDPTKMAGKAGGKSKGKGNPGKVGQSFGQPFVGKGSGCKGFNKGTDFKGKGKGATGKGNHTATFVPPKFGGLLPPPKSNDDAFGEAFGTLISGGQPKGISSSIFPGSLPKASGGSPLAGLKLPPPGTKPGSAALNASAKAKPKVASTTPAEPMMWPLQPKKKTFNFPRPGNVFAAGGPAASDADDGPGPVQEPELEEGQVLMDEDYDPFAEEPSAEVLQQIQEAEEERAAKRHKGFDAFLKNAPLPGEEVEEDDDDEDED